MVYIRSKKVRGIEYAYLVRSVWDPKKSTASQQIVKYLGKAAEVTLDGVPSEYRSHPKILSFLSAHSIQKSPQKQALISRLQAELLECLSNSDFECAIAIYRNYSRSYNIIDFYENLLKPVMYKVGDLWKQGKISVATEHVCSNTASGLVHTITEETRKDVDGKMTMLVCSPAGEQHNLGCRIIESVLLSKGYQVLNVSPSAPSDSIIRYIEDADPHMIFISVTLPENLGSAERLMRAIRKVSIKPVFIVGQAVNSNSAADRKKSPSSINGVHVLENVRLDEVMRIVKKIK